MKTKLFFFAMLVSVAASAQVTHVEPVSATYTSQTVSFRVWWNADSRDATHLSKVWVWVDYIQINSNNTTSGNSWTRATAGTVSGGITSYDGSNRNGFWLVGNATTNYSATLTVQLTNVPAKFNWCAYVSDYPPNITVNNGTYTFRGTPPFILTASGGATQTVSGTTLAASALTITPTTIRDRTECPGVFCPYQRSDLYIDATHLCLQRTSGAQNWEAWIQDNRDDKYYRIVLMPDNKWWLAQNVKYASVGSAVSGCTEDECGRSYTWAQVYASYAGGSSSSTGNVQGICPPGWLLPVTGDFDNMTKDMGSDATICQYLRSKTSSCSPRLDYYGFANEKTVANGTKLALGDSWYANDSNREDALYVDIDHAGNVLTCDLIYKHTSPPTQRASVRCFRQL
ncbi:MAG: hypothetical protein LBU42_03970 [Prevotellaceae bacterium]|jgi:uncharacterized protein (TIGR02145 family)|nr:hypothetical protein [Prevotellaceae bacterium]